MWRCEAGRWEWSLFRGSVKQSVWVFYLAKVCIRLRGVLGVENEGSQTSPEPAGVKWEPGCLVRNQLVEKAWTSG